MAIANFRKVAACSVRYFLPGTIWFPATRYYPPRPMRLRTAAESVPGEQYKSELKARPCVQAGTLPVAASVLTEEFSGFLVDEMKPGAGEADDGHIGIGFVLRRGLRKPMLYVRAQPWAFEKDMPAHKQKYAELARRVTSVWLRSWRVPAGEKCRRPPTEAALLLDGLWRLKPRRGQPLVDMGGGFQLAYLLEQPVLLRTRFEFGDLRF